MNDWLQTCAASLLPMARSFSRSSGIATEDLLQEVSIKLYRKADKVRAAPHPGRYMRVLARNAMIDHYRKVARRRRIARMVRLDSVYFV